MRRRTRLQLTFGVIGALVLTLIVLLLLVITSRADQRRAIEDAAAAAAAAASAAEEPPAENDPWAGLEQQAIDRVKARAVAGVEGATTLGVRVDAGVLAQHVALFAEVGVERGTWFAQRMEGAVYEVRHDYTFQGLTFGPRWFVQLNPEGPAPEGSDGIVATNAFAERLAMADPAENVRYLNRADEVVQALTEHRFGGGVRLGSALLVYFMGRGDADEDTDARVVGWTVVPRSIDPDGELVYEAYFQWYEGDEAQDAAWQVAYSNGAPSFRPRDQRADDIMARGNEVVADDLIDIRPVSLRDVDLPPSEERDARRRALRYLLEDDRVVEAVGALLAYRAQSSELEYVNWHAVYTDGVEGSCDVEYRFREDGVERAVSWRVDSETGERVSTSEIAELAELALHPSRVSAPEPAEAEAPPTP